MFWQSLQLSCDLTIGLTDVVDTPSKSMDAPSAHGYIRVGSRAVRVYFLLHLSSNQPPHLLRPSPSPSSVDLRGFKLLEVGR